MKSMQVRPSCQFVGAHPYSRLQRQSTRLDCYHNHHHHNYHHCCNPSSASSAAAASKLFIFLARGDRSSSVYVYTCILSVLLWLLPGRATANCRHRPLTVNHHPAPASQQRCRPEKAPPLALPLPLPLPLGPLSIVRHRRRSSMLPAHHADSLLVWLPQVPTLDQGQDLAGLTFAERYLHPTNASLRPRCRENSLSCRRVHHHHRICTRHSSDLAHYSATTLKYTTSVSQAHAHTPTHLNQPPPHSACRAVTLARFRAALLPPPDPDYPSAFDSLTGIRGTRIQYTHAHRKTEPPQG